VPGPRREEVALLAEVNVDYDTRSERGNAGGVSDSVLEARPRPPTNDTERQRPFDLARSAGDSVHPAVTTTTPGQ